MKYRVLFLCATNGIQSPMAEALLTALDSEHFAVASAGILRGETHSMTVEVMKEIGVDLAGRATTSIHDVSDKTFDFVITLCDRSKVECPRFPRAEVVHWHFENPPSTLDNTQQKRVFRSMRDQIAQRIRLFVLVQARSA